MSIKKYISGLPFAMYCLKKSDDPRFVKEVKWLGSKPEVVTLRIPDEASCECEDQRAIYHIFMEKSGSGFFADYNRLLQYLYFAKKMKLVPVVEYSREFSYAEDHPVNGTENPFEYYFKQPAGIDPYSLHKRPLIIESRKDNTLLSREGEQSQSGYARSTEFMNRMADVVTDYIRLNQITEEQLEKDVNGLGGRVKLENLLGVHVRGTDFKRGYHGHPVRVTTDEFLYKAKSMIEGYAGIFLATDDTDAVEKFASTFPGKLFFYQDVIRSGGNETVMKSTSDRSNHHYRLGYEVLRDMLTLSMCGGLLAGLSQVSLAARIHKRASNMSFSDELILDQGLVR